MPRRSLFLPDAAKYVNTSESNLRWWRTIGEGPASYVIGRRICYDIADLDAWIEERKAKTLRGGVKTDHGTQKRKALGGDVSRGASP